jgi:hypothetical protein
MTRSAVPGSSPSDYVTSTRAEETNRLLMSTVAQYHRQESVLAIAPRPRGRLRRLPTSTASRQVRSQFTLVRIASIIELHVASELVNNIEPHIPKPMSSILQDIYTTAEDRFLGTWPSMTEAYKKWLSIDLSKCDDWKRMQALTSLRNAVAHGVGDLTRRQARQDVTKLVASLSLIKVTVTGTRIDVSDATIHISATAGRRFVSWLDFRLAP